MVNFQSQQWDKAPKAHIQDHVPPHTILNKITGQMPERKTAFREKQEIHIVSDNSIAATVPSSLSAFGLPTIFHHPTLISCAPIE